MLRVLGKPELALNTTIKRGHQMAASFLFRMDQNPLADVGPTLV